MRNSEHETVWGQSATAHYLKICEKFFDKVASDYKFILNHFRLQCKIGLIRVTIGYLNRVTDACIVPRKKWKQ